MTQKRAKRRAYVELTAYWGNDDAESTIKVSPRRWEAIQEGANYETSAWGWYEGRRFSVDWRFAGGNVSIDGEDGRQCVVEIPISELIESANTESGTPGIAGIENECFDQMGHPGGDEAGMVFTGRVPNASNASIGKTEFKPGPVLIVVTKWPGGTMAIKFGSAMQAALGVSKEDMCLIQMSPERIFRVETTVNEDEFRKAMYSRDMVSGGTILFIEIPKI